MQTQHKGMGNRSHLSLHFKIIAIFLNSSRMNNSFHLILLVSPHPLIIIIIIPLMLKYHAFPSVMVHPHPLRSAQNL
ncbi:hypothetical protein Lalb_Chr03g0028681 [Lupinus albus]|uniref:Uncharacterized protein n=1 Tax=Lupinus albus TaxID=3870 RepID=A0A6A4QV92_LUPAL|nr:hypothetical protein Lalb_Chr03g0028681 [Lupinus albus]